jgi:hypothetical protein
LGNISFSPETSAADTLKLGRRLLPLKGELLGQSAIELSADEYIQLEMDLQPWTSPIYGTINRVDLCQLWLIDLHSPDALAGDPAQGVLDTDIIEDSEVKHFLQGRAWIAMAAHDDAKSSFGEIEWRGTIIRLDIHPEPSGAHFTVPRTWTAKIIYKPMVFAPKSVLPRFRCKSLAVYLNAFQP